MGIRNSIAGALPQLIVAHDALLARAHAMGIDFDIADYGGVRTFADTVLILSYRAADYAAAVLTHPSTANIPINTWRPIAPFGSSMHNYGAAFDVIITQGGGDALDRLKAIAPQVGLSSSVPNDPPHFELPISLDEAKAAWDAQGNAEPGIIHVLSTSNVAAASTVVVLVGAILALAALRRNRVF